MRKTGEDFYPGEEDRRGFHKRKEYFVNIRNLFIVVDVQLFEIISPVLPSHE